MPETTEEKRKIFTKWPRLSQKEKRKRFVKAYKEEKSAIDKLIFKLKPSLKKEIVQLWDEYKNTSTPEARFANQLNVLAVLMQAVLYRKRNKDLPVDWLWEWSFEKCDDPLIFEFIEELKEKFYRGNFIFETVSNFLKIK